MVSKTGTLERTSFVRRSTIAPAHVVYVHRHEAAYLLPSHEPNRGEGKRAAFTPERWATPVKGTKLKGIGTYIRFI